MIFDVQISNQADLDLREIFEYIAFELSAPETALKQLDRLEKAINNLDYMPLKYRIYDREPWKSRGLRVLPVDHYLIFYIVNMDRKKVMIVRVMYTGRNIEEEL